MVEHKHSLPIYASHTCLYSRKETLQMAAMGKILGDALKKARLNNRLTQSEVATHVGVSRAAVGQWESGETEPATGNLITACQLLGLNMSTLGGAVTSADALAVAGPKNLDASKSNLRGAESEFVRRMGADTQIQNLPRDVPVFGLVEGGPGADFWLNGEIVEYVRRPLGAQKHSKIYALYVVGTSMVPRYDEGDLIYVSPSRTPAIGDYVVVELHAERGEAGRGFIKRLVKRTPTKIVCEQFNPPKMLDFALSKVKSIHRVIPWGELLGI